MLFAGGGVTGAGKMPPDTSPRWRDIFETMAGDLSPEEKDVRLKALGFLHKSDDVRRADNFFSISSFQPTEQLWQRLKGDDSWKDGAEERLYALTNGWQQLLPQFMRGKPEELVAATEPPATLSRPGNYEAEVTPAAQPAPTRLAPVRTPKPSPPVAETRPRSLVPAFIGVVLIVLTGAVVLALIRRR